MQLQVRIALGFPTISKTRLAIEIEIGLDC